MGLLANGQWQDEWYDTKATGGRFKRSPSQFRHWITADGSAGPTGDAGFKAESGRYHLYISYACPWANRAMLVRALKGLEDHLDISVVNPLIKTKGWEFTPGDGVIPDPLYHIDRLYELYLKADANYYGRVTVPVLRDKRRETIVSNESGDILRMLGYAFDAFAQNPMLDLYPEDLKADIDVLNDHLYRAVNNGVYKAGFATSQEAYEEAVYPLFEMLDTLEERLKTKRFLLGERITESDIRFFTSAIRFDAVYHGHFKCNIRRLNDYPNISGWMREIYQMPGVADTIKMDHIKSHYYCSHQLVNPNGIIPVGPDQNFTAPHGRDHLPIAPI